MTRNEEHLSHDKYDSMSYAHSSFWVCARHGSTTAVQRPALVSRCCSEPPRTRSSSSGAGAHGGCGPEPQSQRGPAERGAARGHAVTSDPRAEQDPARRPRSCHPLAPSPCPALCALSHVRCWESQLSFAPSLSQHHVHCTDAQCVPINKHLFIYG